MEQIEQRVLELVAEYSDVPVAELARETALEELGFDSLVLIELAMKLRKDFGVEASDDDLSFVETVGELLDMAMKAQIR